MHTAQQRPIDSLTSRQDARQRLLFGLPVTQRRMQLGDISTALVEGGSGPPVVLLHGPGGNATHWLQVIPGLVPAHRVIAPDLPGQGASDAGAAELDADHVLAWLGELIARTCDSPPALVGYALGAAIAARFAVEHGARLRRLVLIDALGLRAFAPANEFGAALNAFLTQPDEASHDRLWRYCARDLDSVRDRMGGRWQDFRTYNVERARTPSAQAALGAQMQRFGLPAIAPADLARIAVPTTLIWGRHDLATPLAVAEAASRRCGWPLHVVEDCGDDPPIEQPEALLRVLHDAIAEAAR